MPWHLFSVALLSICGLGSLDLQAANRPMIATADRPAGSARQNPFRFAVDQADSKLQETPIESAARRYRLQIYETYRSNRSEFDRRRKAWEELQNRFTVTGSRGEDEPALLEWLEQATYQSRSDIAGNLPAAPEMGAIMARARQSAGNEKPALESQPPATEGLSKAPIGRHPTSQSPQGDLRASLPAHKPVRPNVAVQAPLPQAPAFTGSDRGASPSLPEPGGTTNQPAPWQPASPDGRVGAVPGAVYPPKAVNSIRMPQPGRAPPPRSLVESTPGGRAANVAPADDTRGSEKTLTPHEGSLIKALAGAKASSSSDSMVEPSVRTNAGPRLALRPRIPEILDQPDPRIAGVTEAIPPRGITPAAGAASSTATPLTATTPFVQASGPSIDVAELLARASGYGVGLQTVQSVLLDKHELAERDLARLVHELESLLRERHDLLLYQQLINREDHERLVRSLEFPQAAVAELGSSIAAARENLASQADLPADKRELRLRALDDLSDRLSRMSPQ